MLEFAKKCPKLEKFVHVSTGMMAFLAYVSGERAGLILEDNSSMEEMAKKTSKYNLKFHEKSLVEAKLKELNAQNASEVDITTAMKSLGTTRAKMYGWPNTYTLTKVMGEMYLEHAKSDLPVAVIRPTMITSTYKEPFPGWIEGFRTIDLLIGGYWKGKFTGILVNPLVVADVVLRSHRLNMTARLYMQIPLQALKFMKEEFDQDFEEIYVKYNLKIKSVKQLVDLCRKYLIFKGIFDDTNAQELRKIASEKYKDAGSFSFDSKCIDWEDCHAHSYSWSWKACSHQT